jgi:hypothetical protein
MADTQNTIYAQAYSRNIMQLAQQKYSKLMNTVYLKPNVQGKTFFQDQIGKWAMEAKAGRNVQTPNNDPNLARRMGTMIDYHDARLLDRGDELRTISDPRSAYSIAAGQSLGRQIDDVIIDQALGTSYYGETGTSSITLGTDAISGVSHIAGTPSTLTFARIRLAKRILDLEDVEMEDRYFVVNPIGLEQLLGVTEATSSDYNAIKALIRGEIDTWMGFKWITHTGLPVSGTITTCLAYQRYGVCTVMGSQPMVRTDERTDLSYSWQLYYELNIGAVRLEESRVVKVDVIPTA